MNASQVARGSWDCRARQGARQVVDRTLFEGALPAGGATATRANLLDPHVKYHSPSHAKWSGSCSPFFAVGGRFQSHGVAETVGRRDYSAKGAKGDDSGFDNNFSFEESRSWSQQDVIADFGQRGGGNNPYHAAGKGRGGDSSDGYEHDTFEQDSYDAKHAEDKSAYGRRK